MTMKQKQLEKSMMKDKEKKPPNNNLITNLLMSPSFTKIFNKKRKILLIKIQKKNYRQKN